MTSSWKGAPGALLLLLAAPAVAQDTNQVGPAELRDFSLQPTAPEPAPPVVIPAPPPPDTAPTVPPAPPKQEPAPARTAPTPAPQQESAPAPPAPEPGTEDEPAETNRFAPAPAAPANEVSPSDAPLPEITQAEPGPVPVETADTPAVPAWAWIAGGVAAALLVGWLMFGRRRRRNVEEPEERWDEPEKVPTPAPLLVDPQPDPVAAPNGTARPWIALEFKPSRAAANDAHAAIQYELVVRNEGDAAAHDLRLEARLLNAGATQNDEIRDFFEEAAPGEQLEKPLMMAPGGLLRLRGLASMPREAVQAVQIDTRTLFIPMIAFNARYRWDGGEGQTSVSYLIGRQPSEPGGRMAPFRLDLGPRVYGALEHRPGELALRR